MCDVGWLSICLTCRVGPKSENPLEIEALGMVWGSWAGTANAAQELYTTLKKPELGGD